MGQLVISDVEKTGKP
jgi:nitrate reductase gamma subunit